MSDTANNPFPQEWADPVAARYAALLGAREANNEVRGQLHAETSAALRSGFEDPVEPWARELPDWLTELATDAAAWQAHQARIARGPVGGDLREMAGTMLRERYTRLRRRTFSQITVALVLMVVGGALLGFNFAVWDAHAWWEWIIGAVLIAYPAYALRKDIRWLEQHAEDTLASRHQAAVSSPDLRSV